MTHLEPLEVPLRPDPQAVRIVRIHDLRHSFAVATLLHWYEAGINPTGKLLQLSTFLGHSKIKATAVYLTITWELLREARSRFAKVAATAIPEVAS